MFNSRRSEIEIIGEILSLSRNGARKTEILYQTNMNFSQLQRYLSYLIENDCISENSVSNGNGLSSKLFVNTPKGDDLLEDINKVCNYFK